MIESRTDSRVAGSFRDPSGFLFRRDGVLYRQINSSYREGYDRLMSSGLYEALVDSRLLVPHREVEVQPAEPDVCYRVIEPEPISFISYPYEWSFSQLRDAALTTLQIEKKSLDFGMSLKDSSAYNIQFRKGRPILIDTLSFEEYREGQPWVAYRQFCQHFLAPLALMSYVDVRLGQLLRVHIDGVPLDLASRLLPLRTRFRFSLQSHIHLHARSQRHFSAKSVNVRRYKMSRFALVGLIGNLESSVRKLGWRPAGTEWADYYEDTNYSPAALEHKRRAVSDYLDTVKPRTVWDLGANVGVFSRIAGEKGIETLSFDVDPGAVEKSYLDCVARGETNVLPLLLDLTNPSPGIGWQNEERMPLLERGGADVVLALALVHHLAISNNVPLGKIAGLFSRMGESLIIEFVPKSDSQVQRLLASREDVFPSYTEADFEQEFGRYFSIEGSLRIADSERTLYLMRKANR